jgi:energy-coupling factor transport system substrate-specific component
LSWQLGSFALLAIALGAGFAWYERDRPDARIVALVGTLAAFAALGRIAFAALPNVKPTTDIVLISGYALGGGPGFAVGALAGLTSNFFFGQGPWTPWQMAAWGGTGVLGAALAWAAGHVRGRQRAGARAPIGRWPLALVCCAAGFAFTIVQDVGDWVNYSDHSSSQLAVYVGKGLGFDAVHAGGCLVFALAFGPALARSIARFARRLQVRWIEPGAALPVIAGALALSLSAGLGSPPAARAGGTPATYLRNAENADGGFGPAPGQSSAGLYTGWAALGLAAAGQDLQRVTRGAGSLIAYTRAQLRYPQDPGSLERTILVVRAAGLSPRGFAGQNLLAALERHIRSDGSVSDQVNLTAFAILAVRAAGAVPATRTIGWLERQQNRDGGFGFARAGQTSDPDDTGAALEALAGVGGATATGTRGRAVAYLSRQQNRDGGLPSQNGGPSNAQSTAWAIQGLVAAGIAPGSLHRAGAPAPPAYLRSLLAGDGRVRYARGTDQTPVWVTGEALMALESRPLPLLTAIRTTSAGSPPAAAHPSRRRRSGAAASSAAGPIARSGAATTSPRGGAPVARRRRGRTASATRVPLVPGSALIHALAGEAGLATALVLAPMGIG